jgi:hypothetical protein
LANAAEPAEPCIVIDQDLPVGTGIEQMNARKYSILCPPARSVSPLPAYAGDQNWFACLRDTENLLLKSAREDKRVIRRRFERREGVRWLHFSPWPNPLDAPTRNAGPAIVNSAILADLHDRTLTYVQVFVNGFDQTRLAHFADSVVTTIGDVDPTICIERHAARKAQSGLQSRSSVSFEDPVELVCRAAACDCFDHSVRPHTTDALMERRGEIQAAVGTDVHLADRRDPCRRRLSAVAGELLTTVPCERLDHAVGRDAADALVGLVVDEHGTVRANRKRDRRAERRGHRRAAVPRIANLAGARNALDDPIQPDLPDNMIAAISDVERAIRPVGNIAGIIELGLERRPAVPGQRNPPAGIRLDDARLPGGAISGQGNGEYEEYE